jgi:LysR family transcriptional activator of glutamate synthase operon
MRLSQLRYFCVVAKYESITRASEDLRISQPSLSKTIIELEDELGVPLFDRIGRNIQLNDRGKLFYSKIKDSLDLIDSAKSEAIDSTMEPAGEINLLILAASLIMPDIIVQFQKKYPKIKFNLHQQVRHDLRFSDEYDLCISATPMDYSGLETLTLLTEEIVLVVPKGHKLASRKEIELAEAADCQFLAYSPGPSLRVLLDGLCYMAGFSPKIIFEGDSVSMLHAMIQAEMGVTLLPVYTYKSLSPNNTVSIKISKPVAQRKINLSWNGDKYMPKQCQLFMDFCLEYFNH